MATQYRCGNERRRQAVRGSPALNPPNGIDHLEVLSDQRTLRVHFLKDLPTDPERALTPANVLITGGVRVRDIRVAAMAATGEDVLTIVTTASGDFADYTLSLVTSPTNPQPPAWLDPQLAEVAFTFKIDCPADFDCRVVDECPEPVPSPPVIDYLAKDYASFRQLILDRLAIVMPDWTERNPADVGIALVETLAYAADGLSYFQDAVATEAYLGTARKRASIRRHARLLDYPMHDGANARAWVHVRLKDDAPPVRLNLGDGTAEGRTRFLTRCRGGAIVRQDELTEALASERPEVFEPLHDQWLDPAHNEIRFYTWGDENCCLPAGATRATLRRPRPSSEEARISPGTVLIFEEVRGPGTGDPPDADPTHRHAVRLTEAREDEDPLFQEGDPPAPVGVLEIAWAADDALPFPLCLSATINGELIDNISVARGNVVLADHGRTVVAVEGGRMVEGEQLPPITTGEPYRPRLGSGPVTQLGHVAGPDGTSILFDPDAPAAAALRWELRAVRPAVALLESGERWQPQRDLLASDRFAPDFVVETEDDGRASLRFGRPPLRRTPLDPPRALYRVGNGKRGNVGADAIAHLVDDALAGLVAAVRNPLPASGGVDPEPIEQVRLYAPQGFRTQERAVTPADYAAMAERHAEVQKAAATRRWTGSWYTMFLTIDRARGLPIDAAFEDTLRRHLERFRLAGHDLEIEAPRFVPLDIALTVCLAPGYVRADVRQELREAFSNGDLPGGGRGFFHPDNFTFGQPVFSSRIVAAAMRVAGVTWVDVERFHRWGERPRGELERGGIEFGRLEIARLDNDPSLPENGRIEFVMQGGL